MKGALAGLLTILACCRGDVTPPPTPTPTPVPTPKPVESPTKTENASWDVPPLQRLDASIAPGVGDSWAFLAWTEGQAKATCMGRLELCGKRLPAASTFKIPHAAIALETAVLSGPDHTFKWDGKKRWLEAWNRDHTLASAIRFSTVWYFRKLAPMIGRARMKAWLGSLDIGNQTIGAGLDLFWLDGALKISAVEQVRFWHRLFARDLPLSEKTIAALTAMTLLSSDTPIKGAALHGKTGWFRADGETNVGWFVGCVLTAKRVCFASVIEANEPFDHERFIAARRVLAEAGLKALAAASEP